MKNLIMSISLGAVTACASGPYPTASPYFTIPQGSHLILKQSLTIPPDTGRVYIQQGLVVSDSEKDQYYPHCWFVSWVVNEAAQQIKPDDFIITSSRKNESYAKTQQRFNLANASPVILSGIFFGATAIEYSTELTIHSNRQPNIRQLICSHWEDPADANHLSLTQINTVLGDIAEIRLK